LANFIESGGGILKRIKSRVKNVPNEFKDWSERVRFEECLYLEDGQGIKTDVTIYCTGPRPSNTFTLNLKKIYDYIEVNR